MAQLSYSNNPSRAYAGMIADGGFKDIISAINAAKQVAVITFASATNNGTYTVTINGNDYDTVYADASPTAAELQDAVDATLAAAITAGDITSTSQVTSTTLYIVGADSADMAISLSVATGASDSDWSLAERFGFEDSMPFGVFVCMDNDAERGEQFARLPYLAADVGNPTLGVSVQVTAQEPNNNEGHDFHEVFPVCNKGRIWVIAEETLAPGDAVYVRFLPNGAGKLQLGAIRNDADSSTCGLLSRAKIVGYTTIGSVKLGLVELS